MNKIIICYQINGNSQTFNYTKLYEAIGSYKDYSKAMNSVYFIKTTNTPTQVYNFLSQFIDSNDSLWCDYISPDHVGVVAIDAVERLK